MMVAKYVGSGVDEAATFTMNPDRFEHSIKEFHPGAVWLASYQFLESENTFSPHPCIVLSTDIGDREVLIIRLDHVEGDLKSYNPQVELPLISWDIVGLHQKSKIALDSVRPLDITLFNHYIGTVSFYDWGMMRKKLLERGMKWKIPSGIHV